MRFSRPAVLLIATLALACGDDPFSVEDALGMWDLQRLNDVAISGTAPVGVWIRRDGGADSASTPVKSIVIQFMSGLTCEWVSDDGLSGATTRDDCQYDVAVDGTITLTLGSAPLSGSAEKGVMTLTDGDTNVFEFRKRM